MSNRLFAVTLTDLATYEVTVAAETPDEAKRIAKTVLYEEMTHLPDGSRIVKRETEASADPAQSPGHLYRVSGIFNVDFAMTVPAGSPTEAERHAKRIYDDVGAPFEFDIADSGVRWTGARVVLS
jgi:hypothetical protein